VDNTGDEALPEIADNVLRSGRLSPQERNELQELIWPPFPEISKRCRRDLSQLLEIEDLYRDAGKFDNLIYSLFVTFSSSDIFFSDFNGADRDQIDRHVHRNPSDWSVEFLWDYLGAFDVSDRRFAYFLEGLSHADVQTQVERQHSFVEKVNSRLADEGLELRETGTSSGYPLFQLLPKANKSRILDSVTQSTMTSR
jgi:AbiJ N-terminal domain 3